MSKQRTEVKVALVAFGVLLGLVAGWFLVVAPNRHDAADLKQQIADTRDQISVAQGVRTPTAPPPIRVAELFKLSRAMPNTVDIPGVILQLSGVAAETGVKFESITPHDPVSFGAYQQARSTSPSRAGSTTCLTSSIGCATSSASTRACSMQPAVSSPSTRSASPRARRASLR